MIDQELHDGLHRLLPKTVDLLKSEIGDEEEDFTKAYSTDGEGVWRHPKDFQFIFLATSEQDQPRVRPVTLVHLGGKFWIVMGTNDAKTKQIRKNPKIEFCLLLEKGENRGYIKGTGLAQIIKDRETRAKIAEHCNFFSKYYGSSEDPNYILIQLQLTEIEYLRPDETIAQKITP